MPSTRKLPRAELVKLRRQVGLPDSLPGDVPDPEPGTEPRCACGCGQPAYRRQDGRWSEWTLGHNRRKPRA